jgi:hypothetical protein
MEIIQEMEAKNEFIDISNKKDLQGKDKYFKVNENYNIKFIYNKEKYQLVIPNDVFDDFIKNEKLKIGTCKLFIGEQITKFLTNSVYLWGASAVLDAIDNNYFK